MKLLNWIVLHVIILIPLWGFGGQEIAQETYSQSTNFTIEYNQAISGKIQKADLFSFHDIFFDSDVEEEEEEDRNDANSGLTQSHFLPLAIKEICPVSLSSCKKQIKLFILFHSWKLFLNI